MVLFHYRSLSFRQILRAARGFTLLEIILVLFVLGSLAAALTVPLREMVEHNRRAAEIRNLEELAATVTASFENTDLNNLNVAAMPGTIGAGDSPTAFSNATSGNYPNTASADWFAKVARIRGGVPLVGITPAVQPILLQITQNSLGNARWLYAGPAEAGRQRFVLVSLMARSDQLAAWGPNSAGMTQTHKLCVRRIVLPKFRVTVNNNHPSEAAFLSFNNTANAFSAAASTGATQTGEILGGRLVVVNRGASWPGTESLRFPLRENATVTLQ